MDGDANAAAGLYDLAGDGAGFVGAEEHGQVRNLRGVHNAAIEVGPQVALETPALVLLQGQALLLGALCKTLGARRPGVDAIDGDAVLAKLRRQGAFFAQTSKVRFALVHLVGGLGIIVISSVVARDVGFLVFGTVLILIVTCLLAQSYGQIKRKLDDKSHQ